MFPKTSSTGSIAYPRGDYPLHAMVSSAGFEKRSGDDGYDWHGLRRGNRHFALFQYTLEGEGRLNYEGDAYTVKPGQAMLLYFPHNNRYWLPGGGSWRFFYLCVYGSENIRAIRYLTSHQGPLITINSDHPVIEAGYQLCLDLTKGRIKTAWQASRRSYDFIMRLMDDFATPPIIQEPSRNLKDVIATIKKQPQSTFTVDDLAAQAGYSRYHFSRLFKQLTGLSPVDYVMQKKMHHAVEALADRKQTIKEIAVRCGFSDANYFCRVFKKHYGMSPGHFRKSGMFYS